jgi:AcrR family transcriptional regulator
MRTTYVKLAAVIAAEQEPRSPAGLRERKKLATRQALSTAAMRLAVERGLEKVVVEDIAAAAGVSARTFNNYFTSKYDAICSRTLDQADKVGTALRARPPREPLMEAIANAVLQAYAPAEAPPSRDWMAGFRMVIESRALQGEYLRAQYAAQRAIAEAIAERVGTSAGDDMFPSVLAGAVTAATNAAFSRWIRADPPVSLAVLLRRALACLSRIAAAGLTAQHGQAGSEPGCAPAPGRPSCGPQSPTGGPEPC